MLLLVAHCCCSPPDLPTLLAVPSQPAAVQYTLCVGAHNGRTFVGPQLVLQQLRVQPSLGSLVLRPDASASPQQAQQQQLMQLEWVPADELVVLVLELLAEPVGGVAQVSACSLGAFVSVLPQPLTASGRPTACSVQAASVRHMQKQIGNKGKQRLQCLKCAAVQFECNILWPGGSHLSRGVVS